MNSNHWYDHIIVNDRQARLRSEAERQRLAVAGRPRRPAVYLRVLANVGDWMIAGGMRLKARHQAALETMRVNRYQPSSISFRG